MLSELGWHTRFSELLSRVRQKHQPFIRDNTKFITLSI